MNRRVGFLAVSALFGAVVVSGAKSQANSEAAEARIEAQFKSQTAVDEAVWRSIVQDKKLDSYSIQSGDSLWDLSKSFFGDGFYWSKLWAENPVIGNPHKIEPGQSLVFRAGTLNSAPQIGLTEVDAMDGRAAGDRELSPELGLIESPLSESQGAGEVSDSVRQTETNALIGSIGRRVAEPEGPTFREDLSRVLPIEKLESGAVIEQSEVIAKPLLPPPATGRAELLRDLPKMFVEVKPQVPDTTVTITKKERLADEYEGAVVPTTIAFTTEPESLGFVKELLVSEAVAGFGQRLLIQGKRPLDLGEKIHSVRKRFKVGLKESAQSASIYEIEGVIQVDDIIDTENLIYIGHIVYSEGPVRIGSELLPGEPKRITVSTRGRRNPSTLVVVGGGDGESRRFFGDGAVIYLDRMGADVQVGDELAVQAKLQSRRKTKFTGIEFPIGIARVFHVDGAAVSAVVVVATEEIMIGDRTGDRFPTRLPRLTLEAPSVIE